MVEASPHASVSLSRILTSLIGLSSFARVVLKCPSNISFLFSEAYRVRAHLTGVQADWRLEFLTNPHLVVTGC